MAGLVPAIHVFLQPTKEDVDARDESAFTRVFDALCAGMTVEMPCLPSYHVFTAPPSTAMVCPVMKSLSDEARKISAPMRSGG
jgi:hypothetical protein